MKLKITVLLLFAICIRLKNKLSLERKHLLRVKKDGVPHSLIGRNQSKSIILFDELTRWERKVTKKTW